MTHPMLTWLEAQLDAIKARETGKVKLSQRYDARCPECHLPVGGYSQQMRDAVKLLPCGHRVTRKQFHKAMGAVPDPDPAVLADIASKRALLELHTPRFPDDEDYPSCPACMKDWTEPQWEPFPCPTVRALVSAFATRDGYDPSWGPT